MKIVNKTETIVSKEREVKVKYMINLGSGAFKALLPFISKRGALLIFDCDCYMDLKISSANAMGIYFLHEGVKDIDLRVKLAVKKLDRGEKVLVFTRVCGISESAWIYRKFKAELSGREMIKI